MKPFDMDALRLAITAGGTGAAGDLVRRTLAQHGLMPDSTGVAMPRPGPMTIDPMANRSRGPAALPAGASFDADHFACAAGGRDYMTYVPAKAAAGATGVVLMLHGCTQTHADFAAGTGMNHLAEEHGFVVVYPQQARGHNAQSCWNWFSPGDQQRGRGEPAILAGLVAQVAAAHDVPPSRTFVAGLSAGAAMAVILGQGYDDVFAAVGAHSGLPHGCARDVPSAFAAMGNRDGGLRRPDRAARAIRTIVFHGTADQTVHPANGQRIADDVVAAGPDQTVLDRASGRANGRAFTREVTRTPEGTALLEHWTIEGLGHAWSGGRREGSYTDPAGPDASAEMIRFFLKPEAVS